jgi:predicted membrane protein
MLRKESFLFQLQGFSCTRRESDRGIVFSIACFLFLCQRLFFSIFIPSSLYSILVAVLLVMFIKFSLREPLSGLHSSGGDGESTLCCSTLG